MTEQQEPEEKILDLENGVDQDVESDESEDQRPDEGEDQDHQEKPQDSEDEIIISLDDDVETNKDDDTGESSVFRDMRKRYREAEKARKQAEKELAELKKPALEKDLRPEPTLEDHDYDEEAFRSDMRQWVREEAKAKEKQAEIERARKAQNEEHFKKVDAFYESYKFLSYHDKEDALQEAITTLSAQQQAILLDAVNKPATIIYALGKNPKVLDKLAGITNPIKFAAEAAKVEARMQINPSKVKPKPDAPVKGTSGVSSVDKTLAKLEAQARKTKNRTALIAYKQKLAKQRISNG